MPSKHLQCRYLTQTCFSLTSFLKRFSDLYLSKIFDHDLPLGLGKESLTFLKLMLILRYWKFLWKVYLEWNDIGLSCQSSRILRKALMVNLKKERKKQVNLPTGCNTVIRGKVLTSDAGYFRSKNKVSL